MKSFETCFRFYTFTCHIISASVKGFGILSYFQVCLRKSDTLSQAIFSWKQKFRGSKQQLKQALIRNLISARNFKKAAAIILEFKHSPDHYPEIIEKLQKSTVAYYLSRFQKNPEDQDHLSLVRIQELFENNKSMLVYLAQFLISKGYYHEAAYFVNIHNLSDHICNSTMCTMIQSLKFQIRPTEELSSEQFLELASGMAQIGSLPINFGPCSKCEGTVPYKQLPSTVSVQFIDSIDLIGKMEEGLKKYETIGMDMEWKPNFTKFESQRVALLQISTKETCFLIDITNLGGSQELNLVLSKLFSDKEKLKLGFSFSSDISVMLKSYPLMTCFRAISKFLDLQKFYQKVMKVQNISLTKACQNLLKEKLCKRECISNWQQRPLRGSQLHYAALDAFALLEVYEKLSGIQPPQESDLQKIEGTPKSRNDTNSKVVSSQKKDVVSSNMKYKNIEQKQEIFKRKIILQSTLSSMKKYLEQLGIITETVQTKWKMMIQKSKQKKNVIIFTSMLKVFQLVEECPVFYFSQCSSNKNISEFLDFLDKEQ